MKSTLRPLAWLTTSSLVALSGCNDERTAPAGTVPSASAKATVTAVAAGSGSASAAASGKPADGIARFRRVEGKLGGLYDAQVRERLEKAGWKDLKSSPKRDDRFEIRAKKGSAVLLVSWQYFQNKFEQAGLLREARFKRDQLAAAEASYLLVVQVKDGDTFDAKASEELLAVIAP